MSSRTLTSIDKLGSVAASGTASATITIPQGTQQLNLTVGCEYAAVAGTSGITVAVQTSVDGTTWVNAKEVAAELQPAAGVVGSETIVLRLGDSPYRLDAPSHLNSVKVTLTNTDATNAASFVIAHEAANFTL